MRATDPFTAFNTVGDIPLAGNADSITVNIAVTNVKEAPEFTGGETAIIHTERTPIATMVGTAEYDADDPEDSSDPTLTLSGADSSKFAITSPDGVLTFKAVPNFESPVDANKDNTYEVSVVATDDDDQTSSRDVTVMVTNVDEVGVVTLSSGAATDWGSDNCVPYRS